MIKGKKPVSKDIRQIVSQKWVCIFEKGISRDLSTSLTGEWEYIRKNRSCFKLIENRSPKHHCEIDNEP